MNHSKEFLAIAASAAQNVKHIDIETLVDWQQQKREFLLIDVREDNEWLRGHLPGAIHLGKGIIERDIVAKTNNLEQTLVLYCGGGFRSSMAGDNLVKMGFKHVISLDGGYTAWKNSDLEIVKP